MVALPISGGEEARICEPDCRDPSEPGAGRRIGGLEDLLVRFPINNRGVLPAYVAPSFSGLFLLREVVDAIEGVGELDRSGEDVPNFWKLGLDR